jgi:hypothetical protein
MGDKADIAKGEQGVHDTAKKQITERLDKSLSANTSNEIALIGALGTGSAAILKIIAVLLGIPDVTWSKVAAALVAIGLALSLIYALWRIISSSLDEKTAIREKAQNEEDRENARYNELMKAILVQS